MKMVQTYSKTFDNNEDVVSTATLRWSPSGSVNYSDYLVAVDRNKARGYGIKGFHRLVKEGKLLPHTYWSKYTSSGTSTGDYHVYFTDGSCNWSDDNVSSYGDWVVTEDQLKALAPSAYQQFQYVQKAAAKIYSSGFDVLVFVAEFAEVRKMFVDTAQRLLRLDLPKNWRDFSNDWLSYRYGWRTLVYDLKDLQEAILRLGDKRSRYSETVGWKTTDQTLTSVTSNRSEGVQERECLDLTTVSIRGSVTADIEIPPFQFNPVVAAWELIPFSFVVDWIFTIGKAISAISFLTFSSKYAASSGYKVTIERSFSSSLKTPSSTWLSGGLLQTAYCKGELEVRIPRRVPITPHLTFELDWKKVLDLLSMITQKMK